MDSVDALFAGAAPPATATAPPAAPAADPHAAVDSLFAGAKDPQIEHEAPTWGNALKGLGEAGLQGITGTGASILAGYRGLMGGGAPAVQSVQDALTYQPRTEGGQIASNLLGKIPSEIAKGADWAGGKTTDLLSRLGLPPWVAASNGATLNAGIQAAPMLLGSLFGEAPAVSRVAPAVQATRDLGLKLTPNQAMAQGGTLGRIAESLTGHAKLERQVSRANAPIVSQIAGQQVGINGPVTARSIAEAKVPHNAVYNEVAQIGNIPTDSTYQGIVGGKTAPGAGSFPKAADPRIAALRDAYNVPSFTGEDAIAKIRELRQEGNARVNASKYDPAESAYGKAQLSIAKALEDQIDRHLQATPQADLVPRFQAARVSLAQINNVQRALNAGKGQAVSALSFAKQLEKGAPLSGDIRSIAESAQQFPRAFQDASKIRDSGPFSNLDLKLAGPLAFLKPEALLPMLGAPGVRALLGSDLYQRRAFGPFSKSVIPSFGRSAPLLTSPGLGALRLSNGANR